MDFEGTDLPSQYVQKVIPSNAVDVTNSKSPCGLDPAKHTAVRFKLDQCLDDDGRTEGESKAGSRKGKGKKGGLDAGILVGGIKNSKKHQNSSKRWE